MTGRTTKGFDDFRWERKRSQSKRPQPNALGYAANEALKELEQVEAKEVLDQQLTREVHDFFAAATRQAAGIVERVARDAEAEAGQRVEQEMEAFLFDALSRMNAFVVAVLQHKRGPVAETDLEPRIANIVGAALDRFRNEGTAELYDKHIGQDPFNTAVDEVQREFRAAATTPENKEPEPVPIEEHKVAALLPEAEQDEPPQEEEPPAPEPLPFQWSAPTAAAKPPVTAAKPPTPAAKPPAPPAVQATPQPTAPRVTEPASSETPTPSQANPAQEQELERFKGTLKALVRQGVMNKDEARAAWQARLATMGLKA